MILNESHENNDLTNSASLNHDAANKEFMGFKVTDHNMRDITHEFINNPIQIYDNNFTITKEGFLFFDYDISKLCSSDIPTFPKLNSTSKGKIRFYFLDNDLKSTEKQIEFTREIIKKILDLDINKAVDYYVKIDVAFYDNYCSCQISPNKDYDKYNGDKSRVLQEINECLDSAIQRVRADKELGFVQNQTDKKSIGFEVKEHDAPDITDEFPDDLTSMDEKNIAKGECLRSHLNSLDICETNQKFPGFEVSDNAPEDVTNIFLDNPMKIYENSFVNNETSQGYLFFLYDITKLSSSDIPKFPQLKPSYKGGIFFEFDDNNGKPTEKQIIFTKEIIQKILNLDINKGTNCDIEIKITCVDKWDSYYIHGRCEYDSKKTVALQKINNHLDEAIEQVKVGKEFKTKDHNTSHINNKFIDNTIKVDKKDIIKPLKNKRSTSNLVIFIILALIFLVVLVIFLNKPNVS